VSHRHEWRGRTHHCALECHTVHAFTDRLSHVAPSHTSNVCMFVPSIGAARMPRTGGVPHAGHSRRGVPLLAPPRPTLQSVTVRPTHSAPRLAISHRSCRSWHCVRSHTVRAPRACGSTPGATAGCPSRPSHTPSPDRRAYLPFTVPALRRTPHEHPSRLRSSALGIHSRYAAHCNAAPHCADRSSRCRACMYACCSVRECMRAH
jgi:hypothetical protein